MIFHLAPILAFTIIYNSVQLMVSANIPSVMGYATVRCLQTNCRIGMRSFCTSIVKNAGLSVWVIISISFCMWTLANYLMEPDLEAADIIQRSIPEGFPEDDWRKFVSVSDTTPEEWSSETPANSKWSTPSPEKEKAANIPIKILSWTRLYPWKPRWYTEGERPFEKCGFEPGVRCSYSSNKLDLLESDAILFKMRAIKNKSILPVERLPHQKWVFYEGESPQLTWSHIPRLDPEDVHHVFNITSTYAEDSDVPIRSLMKCEINEERLVQLQDYNFAANKSKAVAWFVSHCDTPSKRESYARELAEYIPVDIYGACGNFSCGAQSWGVEVSKDDLRECDRVHLNGTYRFYLSFENSLCVNYITEKMNRVFLENLNIIPIVMGYENYSRILPPGSFIDVRDFKSPELLANHLRKIASDDNLYNSYVRRKMAVSCLPPVSVPYQCRLCEYLHKHRSQQSVVDVVDYWGVESKCVTPREFFKESANGLEEL